MIQKKIFIKNNKFIQPQEYKIKYKTCVPLLGLHPALERRSAFHGVVDGSSSTAAGSHSFLPSLSPLKYSQNSQTSLPPLFFYSRGNSLRRAKLLLLPVGNLVSEERWDQPPVGEEGMPPL